MKANCVVCGKEYNKRINIVTCSTDCREARKKEKAKLNRTGKRSAEGKRRREAFRNKHPEYFIGECEACKKVFNKPQRNTRACSKECQKILKQERGKSYMKAWHSKNPTEPKYARCDICGRVFRKMRHSMTCGEICKKKLEQKRRKREFERFKGRYANDPEYRERLKAICRNRRRERYANDPEYRERVRAIHRRRHRERYANDPEYRERERNLSAKRDRERRANDTEYRDRQRKRKRMDMRHRKAAQRLGIPPLLYAAMKAADHFSQSHDTGASRP